MRKQTTTRQFLEVVSNNLLRVIKVEIHYKSSDKVDVLDERNFKESLNFLSESVFADMVGWHFEENFNADGEYIFDSGRMNPYSENVIIAYLRLCDGTSTEEMERTLLLQEPEG